jgi:hypothetical protein
MPRPVLARLSARGQDCALHLEIVRRKWGDARPKVIVVTGHADNPMLQKIATTVPVLRKPLSDPKFELILDVLSGARELPTAGFL